MLDGIRLSILNVHVKMSGFWGLIDKLPCVLKKQNVLKWVCLSFQSLIYKCSQGQGSPTTYSLI